VRVSLLLLALLPSFAHGPGGATGTPSRQAPVVTVDFAQKLPLTAPGNGFLHGTEVIQAAESAGFAPLLDALEPAYWRVRTVEASVLASQRGARTDMVLSGAWRLHRGNGWQRPYEQYAEYEQWLRDFARRSRGAAAFWEVWNEPDVATSWEGSLGQGFEVYLRAERVLRAELGPEALVAGPSLGHFDTGRIRQFADFCLSRGSQVNVLTWHELEPGKAQDIVDHVRWARDSIMSVRTYAPLRISKIHINEVGAPSERYSTGDLVAVLSSLQEARVDAFARSCWNEFTSGQGECDNASLDGIVDRASGQPRANWWVYAAYAAARRAPVAILKPRSIAVIAGRGTSHTPAGVVLIAGSGTPNEPDSVLVRLENTGAAIEAPALGEALQVVVRRIPWRGLDSSVVRLPVVLRRPLSISAPIEMVLALSRRTRFLSRAGAPLTGSDALLITVEPAKARGLYWPLWAPEPE
jgi:xylan 1,4-beta-xylosidase